jgi:hypothetical protein
MGISCENKQKKNKIQSWDKKKKVPNVTILMQAVSIMRAIGRSGR